MPTIVDGHLTSCHTPRTIAARSLPYQAAVAGGLRTTNRDCAVSLNWQPQAEKPTGSHKSETAGRNRWEIRELTVFPAKAWFRGSPCDGLIQTVLRLERTVCKRDPKTGLCKQTDETVFWVSSASNQTPERWNKWIRAHGASRMAVTMCATPPLPGRFPHPKEPRYRRAPTILRIQSDQGPRMQQHPKCPLAGRSRTSISSPSLSRLLRHAA